MPLRSTSLLWEVEVRAASFFSSLTKEASDLTLDVNRAPSIACVSPKWEARMLQVLRNVDADPSSIDQGFWTSRRFEPFVVRLLDIASGSAPVESALGAPYDAVLDRWNGDGLGEALEAVCDDHVEQVEQSRLGDDWRTSFDRSPFDLLPVEVILVRRVRASLGLETPDVDHRLTSIFGSGEAVSGESEHSILGTLEYAFRRCFG